MGKKQQAAEVDKKNYSPEELDNIAGAMWQLPRVQDAYEGDKSQLIEDIQLHQAGDILHIIDERTAQIVKKNQAK